MPVIPFGDYRPDVSDYEAATEQGVLNVVPRGDGFGPFPSLAAISAALGAQCRGAFEATKTNGSVVIFAATATQLFQFNNTTFGWLNVSLPALATPVNSAFSTSSTGGTLVPGTYYYRVSAINANGETLASAETSQVVPAGTSTNTVTVNWGSVSGATGYRIYGRSTGAEQFIAAVGGVTTYTDTGSVTPSGALPTANTTGSYSSLSAGENWQFVQFNSLVIVVQANAVPQVFDVSSASTFGNLAGSPPQARYITVIGRFVVLTGLLSNPNRVQWSGLNDVNGTNSWTPGINSSDYQDFPDGGFCRGVAPVGFSGGVIFQDTIIRQMAYLPGDPRVFDLSVKIAEGLGLYAPYSLVRSGSTILFYSLKGFQKIDGNGISPIGRERVDRTFYADLDVTNLGLLQGVADPRSSRVLWVYKSVNGQAGQFDKALLYDLVLDKFTPLKFSGEYLFSMGQPGITLEQVDTLIGSNLDLITQSFDNLPAASVSELAAFDTSHKLNFFRGPNLEATLQTSEQGTDGTRIKEKKGVRPITDSPVVYASASKRENLQQTAVFGTESGLNAVGICNMLLDTRYSRFKCRIPAGTSWSFINGIEPASLKASGKR